MDPKKEFGGPPRMTLSVEANVIVPPTLVEYLALSRTPFWKRDK